MGFGCYVMMDFVGLHFVCLEIIDLAWLGGLMHLVSFTLDFLIMIVMMSHVYMLRVVYWDLEWMR